MLRRIPWMLIAARAGAAVWLAWALARGSLTDALVLILFVVAFLSDYLDRVVARALGVATRRLRQADSLVDTLFYLVLAAVTWRLHRQVIERHALALAFCFATLAAWYLLDLVRWRAVAGYHSWSAKLFAASLGVWAILLYGFGIDGSALTTACALGTLSHLEGMTISLVLPRHQPDVPTIVHAARARHAADLGPGRARATMAGHE